MKTLNGRTAVITGAASGFGLELARLAAREGMRLALTDVDAAALARAADELRALGAEVLTSVFDVASAEQVEAFGAAVQQRYGAPHLVINNAGVLAGGLIWEHSVAEWQWVLGVNLMGVAHGVRVFTPMMLAAARADADYEGHIVNAASMAGLVNMPNLGVYSVSKHAVVSLSETLYQDLALVTDRVNASVLCPYYVPTSIHQSNRHRPADDAAAPRTRSQQVSQAMLDKVVPAGKVSASDVAQLVFDAVRENRFYIYTHPQTLGGVRARLEDLLEGRNPSDPYASRPEVGAQLREALK